MKPGFWLARKKFCALWFLFAQAGSVRIIDETRNKSQFRFYLLFAGSNAYCTMVLVLVNTFTQRNLTDLATPTRAMRCIRSVLNRVNFSLCPRPVFPFIQCYSLYLWVCQDLNEVCLRFSVDPARSLVMSGLCNQAMQASRGEDREE